MEQFTHALNIWLARHNLPAEGVNIVIEFPTKALAYRAEACVKLDLKPYQIDMTQPFGRIKTMNGLGLTFDVIR